MILSRTEHEFFIYENSTLEPKGEILINGTLEEVKAVVFEMLKTTDLPNIPAPVELVTENPKPQNTVLLIELEENKAYRIKPVFNSNLFSTNNKTYKGGFLNIIAEVEKLLT